MTGPAMTVTGTELARALGYYLRLAERGTTITVTDGKHPGLVRAVITPPSPQEYPPGGHCP